MTGKILLENATDGWTKRIAANSVQVTLGRNNDSTPDQNDVAAQITENTAENPKYNVQGWELHPDVTYSSGDGALTVTDILDLHFSFNKELYLIVEYGDSSLPGGKKTLPSSQSAYTSKIPVVLDQVQYNISSSESQSGYVPMGSIQFTETQGKNTSP